MQVLATCYIMLLHVQCMSVQNETLVVLSSDCASMFVGWMDTTDGSIIKRGCCLYATAFV